MSPIPVPSDTDNLGECIRFLRKEGKPSDQRIAICLNLARKGKKPTEKKVK
jgi:hypothetical protein